MPLRDEQIHALLLALRETHVDEIDCEQFRLLMAQYAELRALGDPLPDTMVLVEAHEHLCANCREECDALIEFLRDEQPTG